MKNKVVYLNFIVKSYKQKNRILQNDPNLDLIDQKKADTYVKSLSCKAITLYCKEYPNELKMLYNPPLVIYYYGNIKLLKKRKLSIIGSNKNTTYGEQYVKTVCTNIKGYVIISGFSIGIDQIAHKSAIDNNLFTIAVLGSGINNVYPHNNKTLYNEIKENHLVISEYLPNISAKPYYFLMRNRIIGALSEKVLVIEAKKDSGFLTVVEVALDLVKEIYALPGSVFCKENLGTNMLLEEGANILSENTKFE